MRFICCFQFAALLISTLLSSLHAQDAKPAEKTVPISIGGILTTDGNTKSLMLLTDGDETPVKDDFGAGARAEGQLGQAPGLLLLPCGPA